jgi:hypothetical protein
MAEAAWTFPILAGVTLAYTVFIVVSDFIRFRIRRKAQKRIVLPDGQVF